MDIIAYQDTGFERAVASRQSGRDGHQVSGKIDEDQNIVAGIELTFGFYVGGPVRGYDVRISLSKQDIIGMLAQINEIERQKKTDLRREIEKLSEKRKEQMRKEIKHEEALARRRERDRQRRVEKRKAEKQTAQLRVVS